MLRIKMLILLVALASGICELSATTTTITYVAGNCKPKLPSFPTISAALAASPAPDIVMVCPGTYSEQVQITLPVTLEGIASGDSSGAVITSPAGGLAVNAIDSFGDPIAAQLWVNNAAGPVTITNLTIDGAGNNNPNALIAGIFTQNSATTANRVTTRNQASSRNGIGVFAEGGTSVPAVTIENSNMHDFDADGVFVNTNSPTISITAVLKNNQIDARHAGAFAGINILSAGPLTISGNSILGAGGLNGPLGIFFGFFANMTGSVSGNTIQNLTTGIFAASSGISVVSNTIANSVQSGISLEGLPATIQGNTITGSPVGIEFNCTDDPNVRSNAISDVGIGLDRVPSETVSSNSYFNVPTIRQGGC
jgi:hypothetical protein